MTAEVRRVQRPRLAGLLGRLAGPVRRRRRLRHRRRRRRRARRRLGWLRLGR